MSVYVVFFGGWKASKIEMELWLASAKNVCGTDVEYDAFPYPDGAGYRDTNAVDGFSKQFDGAINKIGHSSGCAIANELNSRLKGDHSHITLVDLDGFAPSPDQIKKSSLQVWSAEGAKGGANHHDDWGPYSSQLQGAYTASATNKVVASFLPGQLRRDRRHQKVSSDEDLKEATPGASRTCVGSDRF